MPNDPSTLAELRQEIDRIDDAIHDQLMRRGELQAAIGRAKTSSEVYLRPGREAIVLRRLIARHQGVFPKAVLVRIWREVFAAGLSLQNQFSVATLSGQNHTPLANLARDHFGSLTPIHALPSAQRVLQMVSEGDATLGVLPMPQSEEADPWWRRMARRGERVPRGAYAATKLAFVVSLALAVALDFERLFFLVMIVPVILVFFVIYGLFSGWAERRTGHPLTGGIANAVAFAWAIAVTFPMATG
jgi:chorismate mutase